MDKISVLMAFFAGLLSFLSPCVLPLVPAYIGYMTGSALDEINTSKGKWTLLYNSIFFVLGFSIIFTLMFVSVSSISRLFTSNHTLFRILGGLFIIVFGIHTTGLFKIKFLYSEKRLLSFLDNKKKIGSILLGMAFAAGWSPCIGPVLTSILIYANNMKTAFEGLILLVFYCLGMAIPFILTALTIDGFSGYFSKISKHLPLISVLCGVLLIIMGFLVVFDRLTLLSRYIGFVNF